MESYSRNLALTLGALSLAACGRSQGTNESANVAAASNQAARQAAREMHNQMSDDDEGHHSDDDEMDRMHDMNGMGDSGANMQANSMNNSMPMQDDSGHM